MNDSSLWRDVLRALPTLMLELSTVLIISAIVLVWWMSECWLYVTISGGIYLLVGQSRYATKPLESQ
jgi:hypothetical protein